MRTPKVVDNTGQKQGDEDCRLRPELPYIILICFFV